MFKFRKVDSEHLLSLNSRYIVSLDNHVELVEAIADFCKKRKIKAGQITGIGAVSEATFRFLDPATKKYVDKTFQEQMEITNITGNISEKDKEVYLHIHITCSRRDYTSIGGHLLSARINGACELLIDAFNTTAVGRYADEQTGLNLYKL